LLFSILILGLFNHASFSQDLNMLKNTPFIFKGKVIIFKAFKIENDTTLYASYTIQIQEIYKDEIPDLKYSGLIELITQAPNTWCLTKDGFFVVFPNRKYYYDDKLLFDFSKGGIGIFFCKKKDFTPTVKTDNAITLEPVCNTSDCFLYYYSEPYYKNINNKVIGPFRIKGLGKEFNNKDELLEYLKKANIISQIEIDKHKPKYGFQ